MSKTNENSAVIKEELKKSFATWITEQSLNALRNQNGANEEYEKFSTEENMSKFNSLNLEDKLDVFTDLEIQKKFNQKWDPEVISFKSADALDKVLTESVTDIYKDAIENSNLDDLVNLSNSMPYTNLYKGEGNEYAIHRPVFKSLIDLNEKQMLKKLAARPIDEQVLFQSNRNQDLTVTDDFKEKYYDTLAKNYEKIIVKDTNTQSLGEKSFIESINNLPFDKKAELYTQAYYSINPVHGSHNDLTRNLRGNLASTAEKVQFDRAVNTRITILRNKNYASPELKSAPPEKRPITPEQNPVIPEKRPDNPGKNTASPELKSAPSELKSAPPEKRPTLPEQKSAPPEKRPDNPGKNTASPELKSAPSELKSAPPEKRPTLPEQKSAPPEKRPTLPEQKPAAAKEELKKNVKTWTFKLMLLAQAQINSNKDYFTLSDNNFSKMTGVTRNLNSLNLEDRLDVFTDPQIQDYFNNTWNKGKIPSSLEISLKNALTDSFIDIYNDATKNSNFNELVKLSDSKPYKNLVSGPEGLHRPAFNSLKDLNEKQMLAKFAELPIDEKGEFHFNRDNNLNVTDNTKQKYYDILVKNYSNIIEKDISAQSEREKSFIKSINNLPFDRKTEFYKYAVLDKNSLLSMDQNRKVSTNLKQGHNSEQTEQLQQAFIDAFNIENNIKPDTSEKKPDTPEKKVGRLKEALKEFAKSFDKVTTPVFELVDKGSHKINRALGIAKKTPNKEQTNKGGAIGNSKITFKGGKNQNGKQGKNVSPGGRN